MATSNDFLTPETIQSEALKADVAKTTERYEILAANAKVDEFDFGDIHQREEKLVNFAEHMIETNRDNMSPEAFVRANKIFFGVENPISGMGGGGVRETTPRSAIKQRVHYPHYAGPGPRTGPGGEPQTDEIKSLMHQISPEFTANAYMYTVAACTVIENPKPVLREVGKRVLEEAFDLQNSNFPDAAQKIFENEVAKGEFDPILNDFTVGAKIT